MSRATASQSSPATHMRLRRCGSRWPGRAACSCRSTSCSNAQEIAYILAQLGRQGARGQRRVPRHRQQGRRARHVGLSGASTVGVRRPAQPRPAPARHHRGVRRRCAQIVYTSGTESLPKGAMLTHDAVIWQYVSCVVDAEHRGRRPGAARAAAVPLRAARRLPRARRSTSGATNVITGHADAGQPAAADRASIASRRSSRRPRSGSRCCARRCSTATDLSQPATRATTARRSCRWRCCARSSARLPNVRLWNLYGQTEIAPLATVLGPDDQLRKPGSCGTAGAQRRDARGRRRA